ncbi:hypothetical protein ACFPIJ_51675 [Dactylosporangium cerinum]|uniref:DUF304 domain-containing protein n=1 Tax=Dactylosporangium cerinum TaxID=1434730 RepID=A0ABV9WDY8_9ACTN
MADGEPRAFRNWQAMAYFGSGLIGFTLMGVVAHTYAWYASIPCGLLLLAATRQHVIVHATEVELHNVVRQRRIKLSQIDRVSVLYSRGWHFGWRIRVQHGDAYTDTFAFLNLVGFRQLGATFATPPEDAPAPVKELYSLLSARMTAPPGSPRRT